MKTTATLAAVLICTGTLGQATCPQAGALATGIKVTLSDGSAETFKSIGPGRVENYTDAGKPDGNYNILAQGIYLRATSQLSDGIVDSSSRITYNFPLADDQMPLPVPGGRWDVEVAVLEGGSIDSEIHAISFGQNARYTIGACGYDMIPVVIRIGPEDDWIEETLYYLPTLEIALYSKYDAIDEPEEVYVYTGIEAMSP
ncbi:MAG: hypothetical protein AAGM84_17180 [Pseudomonadota bacterium]